MSDPYAPKGWPRETAAEVRGPLEEFLMRLAELGATQDELDQVAEAWDELDPDECDDPDCWTAAKRDSMRYAGDDELTALLERARTEYEVGTTTEEEAEAAAFRAELDDTIEDAREHIEDSVPKILEWIGDDPMRARAVVIIETENGTVDGRTTLTGPAQAIYAPDGAIEVDPDGTEHVLVADPSEPADSDQTGPEGDSAQNGPEGSQDDPAGESTDV